MVADTIEEIRAAEAEADSIVKEAKIRSQKIWDDACKEATEMKAACREAAKRKAASNADEANVKGAGLQEEALADIEREVHDLKKAAAKKEEKAVEAVISQLII